MRINHLQRPAPARAAGRFVTWRHCRQWVTVLTALLEQQTYEDRLELQLSTWKEEHTTHCRCASYDSALHDYRLKMCNTPNTKIIGNGFSIRVGATDGKEPAQLSPEVGYWGSKLA